METRQQGIISKKAAEAKKDDSLNALVKRMAPAFSKALPTVITPERFTRIALTALSSNPALKKCEPDSFLGALMQAAQLGLEPNTPLGQAYLIPYKGKCQFQLGYKGLLDLAYRSGIVSTVGAYSVCEHDVFKYAYGLEPVLIHEPALQDRGGVIGYYAYYKTKDGGFGFEVMGREDVEEFAKSASQSYGNGPWQKYFDEMAKKTVLKKVLKYAPMKSEFVQAVNADGAAVLAKFDEDTQKVDPDLNIVYSVDDNGPEESSEMIASSPEAGPDQTTSGQ